MKSYKDLDIFRLSKALAIQIHYMTLRLPKFELYEEGSQIRRSAKAITAQLRKDITAEDIKQNLSGIWFLLNQNAMRQFYIWNFYLKRVLSQMKVYIKGY